MKRKRGWIEQEFYWGVLAIAFAVPLLILLNANFSLLTGKAIQPVAYAKAGSFVEMQVDINDIAGVSGATFHFNDVVKNEIITIKKTNYLYSNSKVYSQFAVSFPSPEKISGIDLTLKLEAKQMVDLGLTKETVRVYVGDTEYKPKYTKADGRYLFFTITAKGTGNYWIGKKTAAKAIVAQVAVVPPVVEQLEEVIPPVVEQPAPVIIEKKGFFTSIWDSLKGLFGSE